MSAGRVTAGADCQFHAEIAEFVGHVFLICGRRPNGC